jgi:D-threo-aldose 1-dehydrogenase
MLAQKPRDEFVLSTKVGRLLERNPSGVPEESEMFAVPATMRRVWDFSRDGILRSVEDSLERLGLDRIDILYMHDPDVYLEGSGAQWEDLSKGAVLALIELREQGVIGAFGAGANRADFLARLIRECDVDLVMLAGRLSLLEQGALDDLMPIALERSVGVVAAGVFNSGLLGGRRPRSDATYNYEPAPAELIDRANRLADECERYGVTLPEAAIAFPLRHPAVVSVVMGARTAEQVNENIARFTASVPPDLWTDLVAQGLIRDSLVAAETT